MPKRTHSLLFLALLLSLLLLCAACGERPENDGPALPEDPQIAADGDEAPIQWQEPALEALVREKLDKPEGDIYPSELDDVTSLQILGDSHIFFNQDETSPSALWGQKEYYDLRMLDEERKPIKDGTYTVQGREYRRGSIASLADLAHFRNLHYLDVYKNDLQDLSGLEDLPLLGVFTVDCRIHSVVDFSSLKELGLLILMSEDISDITPLAGMNSLDTLCLNENPIEDLSPVKNIPQLLSLYFRNAPVSNIQVLAEMEQLEEIILDGTQVTDLSPLDQLPNLQKLRAEHLPLSQTEWETAFTSPLGNQLKTLGLSHNQITDIRFLADMESLETLILSETQVTDLSPLRTLPRLRVLSLENLAVDRLDLSPLAGLPLKELTVRQDRAALEGLSALEGMTSLKELTITPNVNLTPEDLDRLRAALPGCEIR